MSSHGVCITGMHRSGTSMVGQLLQAAGLWLGAGQQLASPKNDNLDGFFEHLEFVALDDELLDRLGGAWDLPPAGSEQAHAALAAPFRERTNALLASLAAGAPAASPWGWKDPRASLLLDFWLSCQPRLRTLVCLRHPLAVARSLQRRNRISLRLGLLLWQRYNEACARAARGSANVLISHYDAWFLDPARELRRVVDFAGLTASDAVLQAAVQAIKPQYRHQRAESTDALLAIAGLATVDLYDDLRGRAGPIYARSAEATTLPTGRTRRQSEPTAAVGREPARGDAELLLLRARVAELDAELRASVSRDAPYRVGTSIDARRGGSAPLFLRRGWAPPEEAGTWSIAEAAELRLPLHGLRAGRGLAMQARARPMVGPGHEKVAVTLLANGRTVGSWSLDEARATDLDCTIAADLLEPHGPLALEFRIDRPCAPRSIGLSADARTLGILLVSLTLRAVATQPLRQADE
ncbi:MAG: sulfotransferase [Ideonella sp.]|nr:sulfotransferase [Ideonella sp.]